MNTWTTPAGEVYDFYQDALKQSHLLIAGVTGSGKSVIINALIYTALYKSPNNVAFILCDPKMVELSRYAKLPHVLRYADTLEGIKNALQYAHAVMMSRFAEMKKQGIQETTERDIYVIVDEFADLVTKGASREENAVKRACESCIESIGKLGRAAHVHLILATQAPNRQTIKANIALNMTARIGLRCEYPTESRQVIGDNSLCNFPNPMIEHRAECKYKTAAGIVHYNVPMIPAEDITTRIEWWTSQNKGFFKRLFKCAQ